MFAILQIFDSNTIFRKPKIHSMRINTPDGEAFFVVTTEKHLGRVPWKKLENCLGTLKKEVILNGNIALPESSGITLFTPDIFPRLLLINSAADYILRHKADFISKSLTVFDEEGIYLRHIEKLLNCFANIRIVTHKPELYDNLTQILMENYGFSLIVTSAESYDSDVIISHRCRVPIYFRGTVFSNEKKPLINGKVFAGRDITLPTKYEKLNTCNIDPLIFASALYEKGSCSNLSALRYRELTSTIS